MSLSLAGGLVFTAPISSASAVRARSNSAAVTKVLAASPPGFHLASYIQQDIAKHKPLHIVVDYYAPDVAFAAAMDQGIVAAVHGGSGVDTAAPDKHFPALGVEAKLEGPTCGCASGQVSQLESLIASHTVDGLAITAASDSALDPVVATAYKAGIPVISVNSDDPGSKQMAYVGQNLVPSGYAAGKELLTLLKGRKGQVVVFSIATWAGWSHDRMEGFSKAVRGVGLHIIGPVNTGTDPSTGYGVVASTMEGHPNAIALVSLDCCSFELLGKWVAQAHLKNPPTVVGFDILPTTKTYIEDGVVQATVTQDAPLQGYDAVKDLADYLLHGEKIANINTGEQLVTTKNVKSVKAT
jgi:simple sugar transport system substrate-binding protein/ribose transport system substrate-binding protein